MYNFKTKPFPYQEKEFNYSKNLNNWALYWEQGTGKSKVIIDTLAYLMQEGKVRNAIIIAPDGVHTNWVVTHGSIKSQWESHAPDNVIEDTEVFAYHSSESNRKSWEKKANDFCMSKKNKVLAITYSGLLTKKGKKLAKFLNDSDASMVIVDEAHKIKNPDTRRAKAVWKLSENADYKRLLTGTLISQSMFDAYSPINFLDETYWNRFGLEKFWEFKRYFGVWKTRVDRGNVKPRRVKVNGQWVTRMVPREWQELVDYQNQEELQTHLHHFGSRVQKSEVLSDLPEMTYKRLAVPLSKKQKQLYTKMEKEFMVEMENGDIIDVQHGMNRIGKMHQIIQGFLYDEYHVAHKIEPNPRMEMLMDICENTELNVLIWSPFVPDLRGIIKELEERGKSVVGYFGDTDKKTERHVNKEAYQSKEAQFMVANPSVAGEGIDLTSTGIMIYYGHTYSLIQREQSGDRVARPGLKEPWLKIDMVSTGTFEENILKALTEKKSVSAYLMRDYEKNL